VSASASPPLDALVALTRAGVPFFVVGVTGINFIDLDDGAVLRNLLGRGATITAEDEVGAQIDLMTSGLGLSFDDLASDAVSFRLGEVEVKVGRLEKLLRAKELAARPKDIEFLRLYAARLREQAGEG
jgi:hypothetical protein